MADEAARPSPSRHTLENSLRAFFPKLTEIRDLLSGSGFLLGHSFNTAYLLAGKNGELQLLAKKWSGARATLEIWSIGLTNMFANTMDLRLMRFDRPNLIMLPCLFLAKTKSRSQSLGSGIRVPPHRSQGKVRMNLPKIQAQADK